MYELTIITHFAAAHQLREFHGGCERLHGHNWRVEVSVQSDRLGSDGLVIDFREIKGATQKALEPLDHQFLNEVQPFTRMNPSSENIAHHLFEVLSQALNREAIRVSKVRAWESETACATYSLVSDPGS